MYKKLIIAFVIAVLGLAVNVNSKEAQAAHKNYRLAYKPYTVQRATPNNPNYNNWSAYPNSQVNWTHARVNNNTVTFQNPLVCAEAFSGRRKAHLGCLYLNLGPNGASTVDWAEEFNVPTQTLGHGTWRIVYTYKGTDGVWHRLLGVDGRAMYGMITL
jgi:hypothetical protein